MKPRFVSSFNCSILGIILCMLFPLFGKSQRPEQDSSFRHKQIESIKYQQRSNANLTAGIILQGAGVTFLLLGNGNPTFVSAGIVAIAIGIIAEIESFRLKRKAKRILMKKRSTYSGV